MSHRDWEIFMGSLILGNAYWTLACFMGISLVEWVWKAVVRWTQDEDSNNGFRLIMCLLAVCVSGVVAEDAQTEKKFGLTGYLIA